MTLPTGYRSQAGTIGLPVTLPFEASTKDPVFALLIGLVAGDIYGTLTQSRLQHHLEQLGVRSKLPYREVESVTRLPGQRNNTAVVIVDFQNEMRLPIPYSILGYNPGSFTASRHCVFAEYQLGTVLVEHYASPEDTTRVVDLVLEDVHLYGLKEGRLFLDIDGWVDRLLGGSIDDTELVGVMLCRYLGEWHGFAMGYNDEGKGRSGALNFREDKVVFPTPREVKTIGRRMRSKVEGMMRTWPVSEMVH